MSIVQVAKLAGCSHTTVSRVINQKPGVSLEVTGRVQKAIAKLRYVPPVKKRGPVPKSSRLSRTGNVAVLMIGTEVTPLVSPVAAAAVHAVESSLADLDYSLSLGRVGDDGKLPTVVARGDVDGLILHGNPPSAELASRLKRVPAVWMMSPRSETGYWGDRVCPDNAAIGRLAAKYLIDRGHERIGFLVVDATHLGFPARAEAFVKTAEAAGVGCEVLARDLIPDADPGDFRAKRKFIDRLIERFAGLADRPTGLFVPKGQSTLMVFEALRARGIEPGRGVTVIACDNDPVLAGLDPAIATIDVRPDRVGQYAVQQLMTRMARPEFFAHSTIHIEPTLVEPGETSSAA